MAFVPPVHLAGATVSSSASRFLSRRIQTFSVARVFCPPQSRAFIVALADVPREDAASTTEAGAGGPEGTTPEETAPAEDTGISEGVSEEASVAAPAEVSAEAAAEVPAEAEPKAPTSDAPEKKQQRRAGGRRAGRGPRKEVTLKLEDMTVGMELAGTVKSTTAYGAFVGDMGTPTDGLLHVSQLASGYVENVTDVVKTGDKIQVRVLSVDLEKGNFSLTMKPVSTRSPDSNERRVSSSSASNNKAAVAEKWEAFKFDPAVYVDAKVVSVADFGAFCKLLTEDGELDEGAPTEGLIHISELSEERVAKVSDILSVDQTVKVRITATDRKRNRISLSLREPREDHAAVLAEDMAAVASNQPEFKTSFELAFERARAKSGNSL